MLSKSFIQFSVDGWGYVPSLLFGLRSDYGGGNENIVDFLQKVLCTHCHTQCSRPCSRPLSNHTSSEVFWTLTGKSGSVSCGVTAPFSWFLVSTRICLCPPRVYFPVLCKFLWLFGGVNKDLLQEDFCHTQLCFIQSPYPCVRPLLTCTFAGYTQTQFCLSLCEVCGSWCAQGLFESSECLWRVKGLILNEISPLLPSC